MSAKLLRNLCKFYEREGRCSYGVSCKFQHSSNEEVWQSRQWVPNTALQMSSAQHTAFRVMSYNILGDQLAHSHAGELYRQTPPSLLQWSTRYPVILQEILHWAPHLLCLQEVEHFEQLQRDLQPHGYDGLYVGRTGDRTDGCATFWRRDCFSYQHHHVVHMNTLGLRENVALFAVLRPSGQLQQPTAPLLILGNTHCYFNPKRGEVKLGQARVIVQTLDTMLGSHEDATALMCGDFNTCPGSGLYTFLAQGSVDVSLIDRRDFAGQSAMKARADGTRFHAYASHGAANTWSIADLELALGRQWSGRHTPHPPWLCNHPLHCRSVYREVTGQEPPITSVVGKERGCVDYMWCVSKPDSPSRAVQPALLPLAVLRPPEQDLLRNGLPALRWPSDHLSLVADFALSSQ